MYLYMYVHSPCPHFAFPALEMAVIANLCAALHVLKCCCMTVITAEFGSSFSHGIFHYCVFPQPNRFL